jgi:membrane-bound lytic murein transglycosylase D
MIRLIFMAFVIAAIGSLSLRPTKVEKKELKNEEIILKSTLDSDLLAIDFCGEVVPLEELRIAKRYQTMIRNYDNPHFRKLMTKTEKRMRIIEPILRQYGVPADFKYIPVIESAMSEEVTSRKGAGGYWQFMPATATSLGLVVNDTIDDRKHLTKSTHAAAKYLRRLHRQLGSWTLVAAAYNAGPQHILRKMDVQNKEDYFNLRLNAETTHYIYKLLAVKEWFSNPKRSREWGSGDVVERLSLLQVEQKKSAIKTLRDKELIRLYTGS